MSLSDLQDVCIAIGSIATLDLPMVVDLIGIYGLKGPYSTLPLLSTHAAAAAALRRRRLAPPPPRVAGIRFGQFDEENPFVHNSSVLLVQADEGVSVLVVDRIGDIYHSLHRRADVIVTTVGARHKCQQDRITKLLKRTPAAAVCGGSPSRAHARHATCALAEANAGRVSCDLAVWSSAGRRSWSARLHDDARAGRMSGRATTPHDCATPCVRCYTPPRRLCDMEALLRAWLAAGVREIAASLGARG
ncbi:hypothetical protein F511_19641 [Dorcoceras hygrometricum]|uniref:Uncharacterized protein n=1 Tax=Dorcoceras hygrometricum TaxID=472368 RepID=A0A2Z7C1P3_9LAMI|nr:hypothetical protein F511_19641 [Dorcoceras hygrometricum]